MVRQLVFFFTKPIEKCNNIIIRKLALLFVACVLSFPSNKHHLQCFHFKILFLDLLIKHNFVPTSGN